MLSVSELKLKTCLSALAVGVQMCGLTVHVKDTPLMNQHLVHVGEARKAAQEGLKVSMKYFMKFLLNFGHQASTATLELCLVRPERLNVAVTQS